MGTITESDWTGLAIGTAGEDYRLLSSGVYLSGPYNHHVPDADTLMYWRMDESSWNGTAGEVIDRSGLGNHGMAVGAVQPLTALMDRGADAGVNWGAPYLSGPNLTGWQAARKLTVSCWMYARSWAKRVTGDGDIVCQAAHPSSWTDPWRLWGIVINTSGQIVWGESGNYTAWVSGALSLNTWHHLALTWDGATLTGYVDGVAKASASISTVYTADTGPIRVLNSLGGYSSNHAGKDWICDEFSVSKTTRTIDPAVYAPQFVRCSALDAGGPASWSGVSVASPTATSTERWGLYLQATDSPTVPAQSDPGWQQAAIGRSGNTTLDLSTLGLQGRYLHRMWYLCSSIEAKRMTQVSIGACDWSYAPAVIGRRSAQWMRVGPSLRPIPV